MMGQIFTGSSFSLVSKMVHDRLQGVQMDGRSDPKKGRHDPVSIAEEDVLSSLAAKAPKEHQIGELLQTQVVLMQLE